VRSAKIPREPIRSISHDKILCCLLDVFCSDLSNNNGFVLTSSLIGSRHATIKLMTETHVIVGRIFQDQLNHSATDNVVT
jgi:hypothetical protein